VACVLLHFAGRDTLQRAREMGQAMIVFQDANDCPLRVLLPYATYLAMQEQLLDETPPPQEPR
jgi:hypothetical protein